MYKKTNKTIKFLNSVFNLIFKFKEVFSVAYLALLYFGEFG